MGAVAGTLPMTIARRTSAAAASVEKTMPVKVPSLPPLPACVAAAKMPVNAIAHEAPAASWAIVRVSSDAAWVHAIIAAAPMNPLAAATLVGPNAFASQIAGRIAMLKPIQK